MSGTPTQKHHNFVSEPMREKSVKKLPGIGRESGRRLQLGGFYKAYQVLGKFLVFNKSRSRFTEWLKDLSGVNNTQATDCYEGLVEWCDQFL